jgi:hypothetical protein
MWRFCIGVLLLSSPAWAGNLAKTCPGEAFARSCVRKLYRCFDGAGPCTRDLSQLFSAGAVTDCWANGASARLDGAGRASGESQLTTRRGKACLRGTTTWAQDFSVVIQYRRGKRQWQIARTAAGAFDITCPNGKTEHYEAAAVTAGGCGPIADCAAGTCP